MRTSAAGRALLVVVLLAASCAREPEAPAATGPASAPAPAPKAARIRLQLNWFPEPEFGGMYSAQQRGLFAMHGVDVELLQGGADVPAPQLLASGKVELAVVAADQLLTLREAGGDVRAIFAAFQKSPRVVVVKRDSRFATLADLWRSDATVMASDGLAFVKWLNAQHGGSRLKLVPYAGSAAPFIAGSVDAMQGFATSEPIQLELDGVPVRSFLVADTGFDPYDVIVAANAGWLAAHRGAARDVVLALRHGWRTYLDDPGPVNEAMNALNPDLARPVMDKAAVVLKDHVESDDTRAHGIGSMTAARWDALVDQLVTLGMLTAPQQGADVFVNLAPEPASH